MADLLYLTHRIPYPPDKGDKVRSFHILRHLAQRHRVHLGTFVDDPADRQHVGVLRQWCEQVQAVEIQPWRVGLARLTGLCRGEPLSVSHYRHPVMQRWIKGLVQQRRVEASVVFSSAVAPLWMDAHACVPMLMDFVDVDSAKWAQYGIRRSGLMAWVYRREGRLLRRLEAKVAHLAERSYFVADQERDLFLSADHSDNAQALDPRSIRTMGNGVDADFFDPAAALLNPYGPDEMPIVFTGAMDYWPNVDAVVWFVHHVLPDLVRRYPTLRLHIVGRSPTEAVLGLAGPHVVVSGTVSDVRPYLKHARLAVAPLRVARGIQNKVLEAMAMAVPVVAAPDCAHALALTEKDGVHVACTDGEWAQRVSHLLEDQQRSTRWGERGRICVLRRFSWAAHLAVLDQDLAAVLGPAG